jgi:hypothetical protein
LLVENSATRWRIAIIANALRHLDRIVRRHVAVSDVALSRFMKRFQDGDETRAAGPLSLRRSDLDVCRRLRVEVLAVVAELAGLW